MLSRVVKVYLTGKLSCFMRVCTPNCVDKSGRIIINGGEIMSSCERRREGGKVLLKSIMMLNLEKQQSSHHFTS